MFGSKIDLFKTEWLDVVFASKNKNYGAYELRKENSRNTSKSLLIASFIFVLLFFGPKIYALIVNSLPESEEKKTEVVIVQPPPVEEQKTPPPPKVEPPPPKTDTKRFPPPEVKPDDQVRDEEPPKLTELKKADPGQKTLEGDPDADIQIAAPVGEGPKQAVVVEDTKLYDYVSIEKQPEYPGGLDKFREYVRKTVVYPPMAADAGLQGTVYVNFVVEKDGSITDVKVDRPVGGGLDAEAMRVIRSSKKWIPGIQNGKPVRVKYNFPVKFFLQ